MFLVHDLWLAIALCVVTMIGWGSWANTQKLAGKERWPFELYYWDYAIGVLLCALVVAFTFGSLGPSLQPVAVNLSQAESPAIWAALLSGALFNCSNILLVVAIHHAGMSVAFPVGVGLALVIGTVASYVQAPKGNALVLSMGVALIVLAMVASSIAHSRLAKTAKSSSGRGLVYAVLAGLMMGFFYPQLLRAITPDFTGSPLVAGTLTPYAALLLFAAGLAVSNLGLNTVFMRVGKVSYGEYFSGSLRLHSLGILGGAIWMIALSCNVIASGVAGPAVSYALGQGATLVASLWGVFVWKEFRAAPVGTNRWVGIMLAGYVAGLLLIGLATL
jgi:glucose uptake protein